MLDYCYCLAHQEKSMFLQLFREFGGLSKVLRISSYLWVYHREILKKGGAKALNHYSSSREESSVRYTNVACSWNKTKIKLSFKMEKSRKTLYPTPKIAMQHMLIRKDKLCDPMRPLIPSWMFVVMAIKKPALPKLCQWKCIASFVLLPEMQEEVCLIWYDKEQQEDRKLQ